MEWGEGMPDPPLPLSSWSDPGGGVDPPPNLPPELFLPLERFPGSQTAENVRPGGLKKVPLGAGVENGGARGKSKGEKGGGKR